MQRNILIVEDQRLPLKALELAVKRTMPGEQYDVARCYSDAEQQIARNSYSLVLLDHRMPRDMVCTEEEDFDRFSESLENIGYGLIPAIRARNPAATVVGTSSLGEQELAGFPQPDYCMGKTFGQAAKELEAILQKIR
ncbi:MAG: response regulator [Nanoarchaeota archaeon]|nr:response regulator [Nanoarchaeota archaeon]